MGGEMSNMRLSGKIRLAIVISVFWILGWFSLSYFWGPQIYRSSQHVWHYEPETHGIFTGYGITPLVLFWGIWWICRGYEVKIGEILNRKLPLIRRIIKITLLTISLSLVIVIIVVGAIRIKKYRASPRLDLEWEKSVGAVTETPAASIDTE